MLLTEHWLVLRMQTKYNISWLLSLTHFKSEVTVDVTIQRNSNTEHYRCPRLCLCLQTEVPSFISHSLICGFLLTGLGRNCPGVTGGAGETRPAKIVQEGKLGT